MTNVEGRKPEGAPERSPKAGEGAASGADGKVAKRFSVQRKMAVVAPLDWRRYLWARDQSTRDAFAGFACAGHFAALVVGRLHKANQPRK